MALHTLQSVRRDLGLLEADENRPYSLGLSEISLAFSGMELLFFYLLRHFASDIEGLALCSAAIACNVTAVVLALSALRGDRNRQLAVVSAVFAFLFLALEIFCVYGICISGDL